MSKDEYSDLSYNASKLRNSKSNTADKPTTQELDINQSRKRTESIGKLKDKSGRSSSAKIRQFSKVLNELAPIFSKEKQASNDTFKSRILSRIKEQKELVDLLSLAWGLDNTKLTDRLVISQISKSMSIMLVNEEQAFTKEEILLIGDAISKIHGSKQVFGEIIEDELISTDILVNIKSAMLEPSIILKTTLEDLLICDSEQKSLLSLLHKASYKLAKDIAFNWDKEAIIEDRESLFINVLSSAAQNVNVTIRKNIVESLNSQPVILDNKIIWGWLENLNKEILNNDMGYLNHPELDIYWLKDQLATIIISRLKDIECIFFTNEQRHKIWGYFIKQFEYLMISSWKQCSEEKMNEINDALINMSEEEQNKMMESEEFLKPMEIKDIFQKFYDDSIDILSLKEINLNLESIINDSSNNFAMFWGLSDAVCKIRLIK